MVEWLVTWHRDPDGVAEWLNAQTAAAAAERRRFVLHSVTRDEADNGWMVVGFTHPA